MESSRKPEGTTEDVPQGSGTRPLMSRIVASMGLALLAATLLVGAGFRDIEITTGSDDPVETRDDSFNSGPSPRLVVDTFNGAITVKAGSASTIRVEATLKRADKINYQVTQDGDTVKVEAERTGATIGRSPGASVEITAPPDTVLELRTSNGAIIVDGITETGRLDTSNGKITLSNARGNFDARTSNGAIVVSEFVGTVTLNTGNGPIDFDEELTPGGQERADHLQREHHRQVARDA